MTADQSPRQTPALRARDLAVGYQSRGERRAVLERVNVNVGAGELVCLIGPNGIGKSTLIRTLAKLQPLLWGSIAIAGADLTSLRTGDVARRVGVVLTERVALGGLTVRQVVELGRYPHTGWLGVLTGADHDVVSWAIDAVGARHLTTRDFHQLSDGERQRAMVARALAQEPSILVLDEPTAFLDVASRVELMGLLRQLTRGCGVAAIVSTHDLELALRVADRLWLILPGGELVSGAPEDIVLSGAIAHAFEGPQVRFHASDRSFRWLARGTGTALVRGEGVRAAMAAAVLEREGYSLAPTPGPHCDVCIETDESGWHLSPDDGEHQGADFASLATFLRHRRSGA
jgi:iron complex transport system ATP-binding protein